MDPGLPEMHRRDRCRMNEHPTHARHVPGKGRYYLRPSTGEQLVSVTTVLDVAAKPALVPWAAKAVANYAWELLPRMVAASLDDTAMTEITREMKDRPEVVRERASNLGTRIHHLAEAHLTGRPEPDDDEAAPYVAQYLRFLADFGVDIERDVEAAECTLLNTREGYAGTCDLYVRLPITGRLAGNRPAPTAKGERVLFLVDLKSSATQPASRLYESHPLQLEAYRRCDLVLLDDGTEIPTPKGILGTAVLNLRVDDYALIPLPADDAVWSAFRGYLAAAKWLHGPWRDHHTDYKPVGPDGKPKPRRTRAAKGAAA